MKEKTKSFLSNFFGGLISNQRAMDGAKTNPWWVALIIGLFGIILPVLPITISQAKTYGASFLASNKYNFDQNIASLTVQMLKDGDEFVVNDQHLLEYQPSEGFPARGDYEPIITKTNTSDGQYELMIYYMTGDYSELQGFVDGINERQYKIGTTNIATAEEAKYAPSFMVLFKDGLYVRLNKYNSTDAGKNTYTNFKTDWKQFQPGHKLLASTLGDLNLNDIDPNLYADQKDAIYNKWVEVFNKSFISQKRYNTWVTTAMFFGIYFGLVVLMGLLLFLLTRGKNNVFNYLKFMDTEKMAWWSALAPGILAMIVGFIFSNFAQMAFIVLLGLRTMWMAMRQLRPQY